ncbi:MAG TPA: hypothetical protein VFT38_06820 [Vicinamibacteria bacterium]|nr:hypothetical protein [Vicinamibacteria bacterium]
MSRCAAVLAASLVAATSFAQPVPPAPSPSPSPSPSVVPSASAPRPSAAPGPPVVVWLLNGDRLTGTIASESKTALRVQLPFASILIPKSRIERLVRANGKEEVLHAVERVAVASPTPPPVVPTAHLVLVVTGASFWQAWDRKDAPPDPTLRLQVRIDEEPVATWTDATLDPQDLPGALVNTFAFTGGDEAGMAAPHVLLSPPEVQPGRVVLRLGLPGIVGEGRRLGIAYQTNAGSTASPAWRDVAMATSTVTLLAKGPTPIQLRQDRGHMEFARKHMRDVESFRIEIAPE